MHWVSIIGIGIAANLDNLGIGISFGARSTRIPFVSNLCIAALSMIAAYLSVTLGEIISDYIPANVANWSGGILIVLIGLWAVYTDFRDRMKQSANSESSGDGTSLLRDPQRADKDNNQVISWRESLTLGLALAMNCVAGGLGAGVTGMSALPATLSIGLFSLLSIDLGARAGSRLARTWLGAWANLLGGILLVGIGLYEIFI